MPPQRALKRKKVFPWKKIRYYLALHNPYLFTMMHWQDDLTIHRERKDLPAEWRGRMVITRQQRMMMLDTSPKRIFCTSRKIAKTIVVESMYYWWALKAILRPGRTEGMFFVPRDNHLKPVIGRIETKALHTPLFRLMKRSFNKGDQEFYFHTGMVWFNRIEGNPANAGQNMVGPRCRYMLGDEGAYGNDAAYKERLNTALPNAEWLWAGVPNGMRGTAFYRISENKEGSDWSRHRYDIRSNPIYHTLAAWSNLLKEHGGRNTQSFLTQVLGEWGDETVASFAVIANANRVPFTYISLRGDEIEERGIQNLPLMLSVRVPPGAEAFVIGGDLGYSPAPTILSLFARIEGAWWHFATVEVILAHSIMQAQIIDTLCNSSLPMRPLRGVIDAAGSGTGTLQTLHNLHSMLDTDYYRKTFIDTGFQGNVPDRRIIVHKVCGQRVRLGADNLWFCDFCRLVVSSQDDIRPASVGTKQYLTVSLKEALMSGQEYLNNLGYNNGRPGEEAKGNLLESVGARPG